MNYRIAVCVFCLALSFITDAKNVNCNDFDKSPASSYECEYRYRKRLEDLEYFFPGLSTHGLHDYCKHLREAKGCIQSYLKHCKLTETRVEEITDLLNRGSKLEKEMCTEGHPVREGHLKHSPCISDMRKELNSSCMHPSMTLITRFRTEYERGNQHKSPVLFFKSNEYCCVLKYKTLCIAKKIESKCGIEAALYAYERQKKQYTEENAAFCNKDETYYLEMCKSILPESYFTQMGIEGDLLTLGAIHVNSNVLSTLAFLILPVNAAGSSCNAQEFQSNCHDLYQKSYDSVHYFDPLQGKKGVNRICRDLKNVETCATDFVTDCKISTSQLHYLQDMIRSSRHMMRQICQEGHPVRERHLNNTRCIYKYRYEIEDQCHNATVTTQADLLSDVYNENGQFESPGDVLVYCCIDEYSTRCRSRVIQTHCGEETADYYYEQTKILNSKGGHHCNAINFIYDTEECMEAVPESYREALGLDDDSITLGVTSKTPNVFFLAITTTLSILLLGTDSFRALQCS